LYRSYC